MKAALAKENLRNSWERPSRCGDGSLLSRGCEPCKPETRIAHAKIRMARDSMRN